MVDVADGEAGKMTKCPRCSHLLLVPTPLYSQMRDMLKLKKQEPPATQDIIENYSQSSHPEFTKPNLYIVEDTEPEESELINIDFDEESLFAMSFSLCLLMLLNSQMRKVFFSFILKLFAGGPFPTALAIIFLLIPFVTGLLFSAYHAFSSRKKQFYEKAMMLFFGVAISAGAGLCAAWHIITTERTILLMIFAVWNLLYSALIILKFQVVTVGNIDLGEEYVSDRNAGFGQIILGAVAVTIVLLSCHFLLNMHWSITYSVCVTFTSSLDKAIQKVLGLR